MDSVKYIIKMGKLHMKGIGKMISFLEKVEFIMIFQRSSWGRSIIMILLIWDKNGYTMKVSLKMIQSMEKEK